MARFLSWPLAELLITKYFSEECGWTHVHHWESEDLVALELFANSELQRRGEAAGASEHVSGNTTLH